jgi:hypothetical protein
LLQVSAPSTSLAAACGKRQSGTGAAGYERHGEPGATATTAAAPPLISSALHKQSAAKAQHVASVTEAAKHGGHDYRMARTKTPFWQDPFVAALIVGLLIWAAAERHEWQNMAILIGIDLVILGGYAAFGHPHKCRDEGTSTGMPCRNPAYGLLLGCWRHRWDRLRRIVAPSNQQAAPRRPHRVTAVSVQALAPAPASAPADDEARAAKITLWCTVIGTGTGVLSFIAGVVGMIVQSK